MLIELANYLLRQPVTKVHSLLHSYLCMYWVRRSLYLASRVSACADLHFRLVLTLDVIGVRIRRGKGGSYWQSRQSLSVFMRTLGLFSVDASIFNLISSWRKGPGERRGWEGVNGSW